ncbi:hypothetical protein LCGC14_2854840 [marine sediment metagenome]|uniref:Lipoprotein n=1 Tax=marine sediment metagenome TaxID=412755 RepID=A0A0F8YU50_9ZZZZ
MNHRILNLLFCLTITCLIATGCVFMRTYAERPSNETILIQKKTTVVFSKIFKKYPDVILPCDAIAHFAIAHLTTLEIYPADITSYWTMLFKYLDVVDEECKQLIIILFNDITPYMVFNDGEPIPEPTLSHLKAFFNGVILAVDAQIVRKLQPKIKGFDI